MAAGPTRSLKHDDIAALLACEIIAGVRPAGSRMPSTDEMFERFGVSRVVLREVTKTLTAKGLVVPKSKVGTLVLPPERWNWFDPDFLAWRVRVGIDTDFFRQMTQMRRAVEPAAARLAARQCPPDAMAGMRAALTAMRDAGSSRHGFADADLRFHVALAAASGNPLFRSFSSVVGTALGATLSVTAPWDAAEAEKSVGLHTAIADAVEAQDEDAAAHLILTVINDGARRILGD